MTVHAAPRGRRSAIGGEDLVERVSGPPLELLDIGRAEQLHRLPMRALEFTQAILVSPARLRVSFDPYPEG